MNCYENRVFSLIVQVQILSQYEATFVTLHYEFYLYSTLSEYVLRESPFPHQMLLYQSLQNVG